MSALETKIDTTTSQIIAHPDVSATLSHISSINNMSTIPTLQNSSHNDILIHDNNNINNSSTMNDGQWLEMPKMENIMDIFSICCSTAVIFGGLIPYIPQYLKIKRSMNSDGFSTYVCLTLLIANILRIMFWFGHRFELPLLIQSFVMIVGMLAMMEICIRVRDNSSSYVISAIGVSGTNQQRRRFRTGKLDATTNSANDEIANSESMPIYSVLSSSASTASLSPTSSSSSGGSISSPRSDTVASVVTEVGAGLVAGTCEGADQVVSDGVVVAQLPKKADTSYNSGGGGINGSFRHESPILNYESASQQCRTSLLARSNRARNTFKCFNAHDFWDWDDFFSYVKFLSLFTFVVSLLTYLLLDNHLYVETLGFVAVFTESMLGMPQLSRNYTKKSTRGMSVEMVVMWLSGDLFKTLYFIIRQAPAQFYVCGSIQVIVDILILGQVLWYRRPNVTYRKLPKST